MSPLGKKLLETLKKARILDEVRSLVKEDRRLGKRRSVTERQNLTESMFARRQYVYLANWLRTGFEGDERETVARSLCDTLAGSEPGFKPDVFLKAAGVGTAPVGRLARAG